MKMNWGLFLIAILVIVYLLVSGLLSMLVMLIVTPIMNAIGAGDGAILLVALVVGLYILGWVFSRYAKMRKP